MKRMLLGIVFLILFCFVNCVVGENVELVARWGLGTAYDVCVAGDYCYLSAGEALVILDIIEPRQPVEVGRLYLGSMPKDICVRGNLVYLADWVAGLRIIDVSEHNNPREIAVLHLSGYADGIDVAGHYVYLANSEGGLRIIDVSDPGNPLEIGFFSTFASDVKVAGQYAYVAADKEGLKVVDISDPKNPRLVGSGNFGARFWSVVIEGNCAYVLYNDYGLMVIDIANPFSPRKLASCSLSAAYVSAVFVRGQYAYVADQDQGLRIIDVTRPENPQEMGFFVAPGFARGVWVDGNFAYVGSENAGLRIINIADPKNPQEVGHYDTAGRFTDVYVHEGYAYVASEGFGLRILDISDPSEPREIARHSVLDDIEAIAGMDSLLFLAKRYKGLEIVDISQPADPQSLALVQASQDINRVYVQGGYAYVVSGCSLLIIDIANPKKPWIVSVCRISCSISGIYLSGDYIYLADSRLGLRIIDVSDPSSPKEVGFYSTSSANDVRVEGSYAYVADWRAGFKILDVANPVAPRLVGSLDTPGEAYAVDVDDYFAYLADYRGGLRIIDLRDKANPQEIGFHNASKAARQVCAAGGYIYLAGYDGLFIFRFGNTPPLSAPFSFVHITDVHIGGNNFDWSEEKSYCNFALTLEKINTLDPKPAFVLISGDNVEYSKNEWFATFISFIDTFTKGSGIPVYFVPGNHDRYTWYGAPVSGFLGFGDDMLRSYHQGTYPYLENLGVKPLIANFESRYDNFSFEYQNYLFIGLDSGEDFALDLEAGDWQKVNLKDLGPEGNGLADAQISALTRFKKESKKIIFMHHPVFTGRKDKGERTGGEYEDAAIANFRDPFLTYCKLYNVQLVLSGHTHQNQNFDAEGSQIEELGSFDPYFLQTASATKGDFGFRVIEIVGGKVSSWQCFSVPKSPHIALTARGVVKLKVIDAEGNYTGAGSILTDIPHSYYTGYYGPEAAQTVVLSDPKGEYQFQVVGAREGDYQLEVTLLKEEGLNPIIFNTLDIHIAEGAVHQYSINWEASAAGEKGVTIQMDTNGDGTFEQTFLTGSVFKAEPSAVQDSSIPDSPSTSTIAQDNSMGQNYPNPFNGETWIPYELRDEANVEIMIYTTAGELVRALPLGRKRAGFYTGPDKAAYWDGQNEKGERVGSGIYFYTFQAGGFAAFKKMIIMR
ncbi:MAG: metallophosphoesterase [Patescibacteria group bacterium]|nr:metallophosphoesterase [Patescibacteria group bacterium]